MDLLTLCKEFVEEREFSYIVLAIVKISVLWKQYEAQHPRINGFDHLRSRAD